MILLGYHEMPGCEIIVSPDGKKALAICSPSAIQVIDIATKRVVMRTQLASSIIDCSFYDNSMCYFLTSKYSSISIIIIEDNHIAEYDVTKNLVKGIYYDADLFGVNCIEINGNIMAIG